MLSILVLLSSLLRAEPLDIRLHPAEPAPGVVLRGQHTEPDRYRLEPVTVTATGRLRGGGALRQVTHADGQESLIDAGLVASFVGEAGGYRFFFTGRHPETQQHWLGALHPERTLAAWIPAEHGAELQILPDVVLPGAEVVVAVRTWRESCPGATAWTVFAITDGGLSTVASTFSTGEGGWYTQEDLYLPTRQAGGGLVYASLNGDVIDEPAVAGRLIIRREVGEPTEEGAHTSRVVDRSEVLRSWPAP